MLPLLTSPCVGATCLVPKPLGSQFTHLQWPRATTDVWVEDGSEATESQIDKARGSADSRAKLAWKL